MLLDAGEKVNLEAAKIYGHNRHVQIMYGRDVYRLIGMPERIPKLKEGLRFLVDMERGRPEILYALSEPKGEANPPTGGEMGIPRRFDNRDADYLVNRNWENVLGLPMGERGTDTRRRYMNKVRENISATAEKKALRRKKKRADHAQEIAESVVYSKTSGFPKVQVHSKYAQVKSSDIK